MLAQLKTVVLIKEAIKLALFRLVEYLEHQLCLEGQHPGVASSLLMRYRIIHFVWKFK